MQLYVRCPLVSKRGDGPATIALEVNPAETVRDLKIKIHNKGGLDPDQQQLIFLKELLEDGRKLSTFKLGQNSLVEECSTWISVGILGKEAVLVSVETKDTIDSVKTKIDEKAGNLKSQHALYKRGDNEYRLLDAGRTLDANNVLNGSRLELLDQSMLANVYISSVDKTIKLSVALIDTVLDVKSYIYQKERIPVYLQTLLQEDGNMEKHTLGNSRHLNSYGIQHDTIIHLHVSKPRDRVPIFIKTQSIFDNKITINVDADGLETIKEVKEKIRRKKNILTEKQRLTLNFGSDLVQLQDDQMLSYYNIRKEDTLCLFELRPLWFAIHYETGNGPGGTRVIIERDFTVYGIKYQIYENKQIPIDQQVLYHNDTVLKDHQDLTESKIGDGSSLRLEIQEVQQYKVYIAGKKFTALDVSSSTSVYALTCMYQGHCDGHRHHDLIFDGRKLTADCCLGDYKIRAGDMIHAVPRDEMLASISLATSSHNEMVPLKISLSDESILNLKAKIWAEVPASLPPSQQRLISKDLQMLLEDTQTLTECELHRQGTATVALGVPENIFVRLSNCIFQAQIYNTDKVLTLKQSIKSQVATEPSKQQLYYNGKVMNDEYTIESYALTASPLLHLNKSQCIYDPLEEQVGHTGKYIIWAQYGVEVAVPAVPHHIGTVQLRVYDVWTATCFEYPREYTPLSNVYEISLSWNTQSPSVDVKVTLTKFTQASGQDRLCVMAASRHPSKWTPDINPIFSFTEEGLNLQPGQSKVELLLKDSGVYIFVAAHKPESKHVQQGPKTPLVTPVPQAPLPVPRRRRANSDIHRQRPNGEDTKGHGTAMGSYCCASVISKREHFSHACKHTVPPRPVVPRTPEYQCIYTAEHRTMVRCTTQLTDTLAADPLRVSEGLFGVFLIPQAIHDQIRESSLTSRERASKLVATMTDLISASPSNFDKFVAVLREQGSWTNNILKHLEDTLIESKTVSV